MHNVSNIMTREREIDNTSNCSCCAYMLLSFDFTCYWKEREREREKSIALVVHTYFSLSLSLFRALLFHMFSLGTERQTQISFHNCAYAYLMFISVSLSLTSLFYLTSSCCAFIFMLPVASYVALALTEDIRENDKARRTTHILYMHRSARPPGTTIEYHRPQNPN